MNLKNEDRNHGRIRDCRFSKVKNTNLITMTNMIIMQNVVNNQNRLSTHV